MADQAKRMPNPMRKRKGMETSAHDDSLRPGRRRKGVKRVLWSALVFGLCALGFFGLRYHSEWKSQRMLQEAEEKWRAADYIGAVHEYDRLVESYPTNPLVPEAYYWKGVTAFLYLDDSKLAIDALQKAIARAPRVRDLSFSESDYGLKARRYLAEIYEGKLNQPTNAIVVYEGLIEVTPDPEEAQRSRYKIGELYEDMGDLAQARIEWDLLAKNHPGSPWTPPALYRKGGTYFITGNCKQALRVYTQVYKNYPESEIGPFAKFRAANCLEIGKHKEAAYALYKELKGGGYPDQDLISRKIALLKPVSTAN